MDEYRKIFRSLSIDDQITFLSKLSPAAAEELRYFTTFTLRDEQIVPDDWNGRYYIALAGRGWGKSKMGAYWIKTLVYKNQKGLAIVAPTYKDLEDVMIPAILDEFPPNQKPRYLSGNKAKIKCHNGVEILCYTSEQEIRGGNFTAVWMDEFGKFCDSLPEKALKNFQILDFACRKGKAQFLITTTPKEGWPIFSKWKRRFEEGDPLIKIVCGTMEDNIHLSKQAKQALYAEHGGTRLGRQELLGEILLDVEGALWTSKMIDDNRITGEEYLSLIKNKKLQIIRTVVAVDPAVSDGTGSDETGIIIASLSFNNKVYVISDKSGRLSPAGWAKAVIMAYNEFDADRIIAEKNQGGQLVESNLKSLDPYAPIKLVHASKGKTTRAEPVAALYERGKVHHVGYFQQLEQQMTHYTGNSKTSPDRMDALVYAITELLLNQTFANRDLSNVGYY